MLLFYSHYETKWLVTLVTWGTLLVSPAASSEADFRPLLTAIGTLHRAKLVQLSDDQVQFSTNDGETPFAHGNWVRWGHPARFARRPRVTTRDGSVWVVRQDWSTRTPAKLDATNLRFDHATFGTITIPRAKVDLWYLAASDEAAMASRIESELNSSPLATEDRIWLMNGDSLTGKVIESDELLRFQAAGQELELAHRDIAAVAFANRAEPSQIRANYWLGFDDGTVVAMSTLAINSEEASGSTAAGLQVAGKRSQLCYLQAQRDVAYLSDRNPLEFHHTPYFQLTFPLETNRNLERNRPEVAGRHYLKCLAMKSAARVVYQVPQEVAAFAAEVAIDDSSGSKGSAIYRVYRVRERQPELAYESPVVRGHDRPRPVKVDLNGAKMMILVVDFADFGDELDHCLWLDPRWVRKGTP